MLLQQLLEIFNADVYTCEFRQETTTVTMITKISLYFI